MALTHECLRKVLGQPPGTQDGVRYSVEELKKAAEEWNDNARQTLRELLNAI
jgi:hypothetical protein